MGNSATRSAQRPIINQYLSEYEKLIKLVNMREHTNNHQKIIGCEYEIRRLLCSLAVLDKDIKFWNHQLSERKALEIDIQLKDYRQQIEKIQTSIVCDFTVTSEMFLEFAKLDL